MTHQKCQLHIFLLVEEVQMHLEEPVCRILCYKSRINTNNLLVDDYDEPRYMALNSYDNCKYILLFFFRIVVNQNVNSITCV